MESDTEGMSSAMTKHVPDHDVWPTIVQEAERDAAAEPTLGGFLFESVLRLSLIHI